MLTLSPAVRIYVATGATDLRRSIDGLVGLVREQFQSGIRCRAIGLCSGIGGAIA